MADLNKWLDKTAVLDAALTAIKNGVTHIELLTAYSQGDAYATVIANSIAEVAVAAAGADYTLGNQGTNGRQAAVAAHNGVTTTGSSVQHDSGTATGGTTTTLADTAKAWTVNAFAGKVLVIDSGTGAGAHYRIASNTATVLTFDQTEATAPDATSVYRIVDDLFIAHVDKTNSIVYAVTNESTDQIVTSGNQVNIPAHNIKLDQPV